MKQVTVIRWVQNKPAVAVILPKAMSLLLISGVHFTVMGTLRVLLCSEWHKAGRKKLKTQDSVLLEVGLGRGKGASVGYYSDVRYPSWSST